MRKKARSWPWRDLSNLNRLREQISYLEFHRLKYISIDLPIGISTESYEEFKSDRCKFLAKNFYLQLYNDGVKDFIAINLSDIERFLQRPISGTFSAFLLSVSEALNMERTLTVEPKSYTILMDAPRLFWFEYPGIKQMEVRTTRFE